MAVYLSGIGAYVPTREISNEVLATLKGIDGSWIRQRTGIMRRFLADPAMDTGQMAVNAAREAMVHAKTKAEAIRMVVVVTSFPRSFPRPPAATTVLRRLGLTNARTLNLISPCTSFIQGLQLAAEAVEREGGDALVVGAEGFSAATGLDDRRTCYLLSDGAGAMLLTTRPGPVQVHQAEIEVQGVETDEAEEALPLITAAGSQLPRALHEMARVHRDPGQGNHEVPVITQLVAPPEDDLPAGYRVFNPFEGAGHLLSAAVPLSLYRFLADERVGPEQTALLFASCGHRGWTHCRVTIHALPEWAKALSPGRGMPLAGTDEKAAALEAEPDAARLREIVEREIDEAAAEAGSLHCIAVTIRPPDEDPAIATRATREAAMILGRNTRRSDHLLRSMDGRCFVVLLRYIDSIGIERYTRRLRVLLEQLDMVGEFEVRVEVETLLLESSERQPFTGRILGLLGV